MKTEKLFKSINFDLQQNLLTKFYDKSNPQAYYELKIYMLKHGFSWRQGSGYVSREKMSNKEMGLFATAMFDEFDWLEKCAREIDVYNIGSTMSLLDLRRGEQILGD
jgi:virulence-associated protein VapD